MVVIVITAMDNFPSWHNTDAVAHGYRVCSVVIVAESCPIMLQVHRGLDYLVIVVVIAASVISPLGGRSTVRCSGCSSGSRSADDNVGGIFR